MRSFFSVFLFALFCFYSISESLPREGLTWEQALSLALEKNPELLSLNQALPVWEGEKLQAGLKPNPELNVNLEGEETSFSLSQALQRLGKRKARVEVSQKLFEQARLKYKSKQNEIACDVYAHFVAVLVSQKLLGLAEESKILALEVETRVAERV
jgi:cobalt-zinc-cadmium efflux system outer membrane protein